MGQTLPAETVVPAPMVCTAAPACTGCWAPSLGEVRGVGCWGAAVAPGGCRAGAVLGAVPEQLAVSSVMLSPGCSPLALLLPEDSRYLGQLLMFFPYIMRFWR